MILPVLLAISLFFRSYSSVEYYGDLSFELVRVYESISLFLLWIGGFLGIVLLFITNVYRKKYLKPEQFELSKLDKIPSEVFLLYVWEAEHLFFLPLQIAAAKIFMCWVTCWKMQEIFFVL